MASRSHQVIAKGFLPASAYSRAAALWHLRGQYVRLIKNAFRHGWPDVLIHFGSAPGDSLLCSTILRELRKRGKNKLWIITDHNELFDGNHDVDRVVPVDSFYLDYARVTGTIIPTLEFAPYDPEKDVSPSPQRHIVAEFCRCAGVEGEIALRPYFYSQNEEVTKFAWAEGMVAIQSSGLAAAVPMLNKQWYPERFQEVVDRLGGRFKLVQVGSTYDPPLNGVMDLRGKTGIRETAALLKNCRLYIGNVGFLMHLARAVECPAAIIFGGREAPWQSGYTCNINLYTPLPCAPCWLWNTCDYDRLCMKKITAEDVVCAVEQLIGRQRNPLRTDLLTL